MPIWLVFLLGAIPIAWWWGYRCGVEEERQRIAARLRIRRAEIEHEMATEIAGALGITPEIVQRAFEIDRLDRMWEAS